MRARLNIFARVYGPAGIYGLPYTRSYEALTSGSFLARSSWSRCSLVREQRWTYSRSTAAVIVITPSLYVYEITVYPYFVLELDK